MRYISVKEAQDLVWNYTQKLFKDREDIKAVGLDPSLAKEAREAILVLSDNLDGGIGHLPIGVQRYLYECLIQAFMFFLSLKPDAPLPELIEDSMTDDEKLSRLLRHGIAEMELPSQGTPQ